MFRPHPTSTLFPYTTLFRSQAFDVLAVNFDQLEYAVGAGVLGIDRGVRCLHRSEEHTSELQSLRHLVCRLLLEKKKAIAIAVSPRICSHRVAARYYTQTTAS